MKGRPFRDRLDAGAQLAELLLRYGGRDHVTVLGLPRGGVPVAGVVADRLGAPLDALIVRKIGVPGHRELAAGALGPDGAALLDHELMARLGLSRDDLEPTIEAERAEQHRREEVYREGREPPELAGRHILLVDDGMATGASMVAAVTALRSADPAGIVVAVPVASPSGARRLEGVADDVVAVAVPARFAAVGQWYEDFAEVPDAEVQRWLTRRSPPAD